jgi:hypothetical protein
MKDMKRAIRRHHYQRLKTKRKKHSWLSFFDRPASPRELGIFINTPCCCSCHMCGNPRHVKWNRKTRLTLQEQINEDQFTEFLMEITDADL